MRKIVLASGYCEYFETLREHGLDERKYMYLSSSRDVAGLNPKRIKFLLMRGAHTHREHGSIMAAIKKGGFSTMAFEYAAE